MKEDERGSLYEGQKSVEESSRNKAKCLENIQKQDKFEGCSHVKRRAKRSYGGIAYAKAASKLWPGATTVIPRVEALIGLDTADTCSTPEGTGEARVFHVFNTGVPGQVDARKVDNLPGTHLRPWRNIVNRVYGAGTWI